MSTRTSYDHGTPCWIDLVSPDLEAAKAFCEQLFGWDSEDLHDDAGQLIYVNMRRGGKKVVGLGPQPPSMAGYPAIWNSYVAVDSVDDITARVEKADGSVMMPAMDIWDTGRMAIYQDRSGAAFGVWQAGTHFGAEVCNEPGTWSWNELVTRDIDAATGFYADVFGWTYEGQEMPFGTYHVIEGGEEGGLGGLLPMPPGQPDEIPDHWGVYFTVADLDATLATAQEHGAQVIFGPQELPGVGTSAMLNHPAAGGFTVIQPVSD